MRRARNQPAIGELRVQPETPEKQFQAELIGEAVAQGWVTMHVLRSTVGGHSGRPKRWLTNTAFNSPEGPSSSGWPDVVLIHPAGYMMILELKGPDGRPSDEQLKIMRLLQKVARFSGGRIKAAVVYPVEWPTILKLLRSPNR